MAGQDPTKCPTMSVCVAVKDANAFADFAAKTFGGKVTDRFTKPDGSLMHAQVKFSDSQMMVGEMCEQFGVINAGIYVYVDDPDKAYTDAMEAGSKSLAPVTDQFWGDRQGGVRDRWGNTWWIAKHVEDVSKADMQKRATEMAKSAGAKK